MGKDVEGSGRGINLRQYTVIYLKVIKKNNNSVRIAGPPDRDLNIGPPPPNKKHER
jgi:hypothetical protein